MAMWDVGMELHRYYTSCRKTAHWLPIANISQKKVKWHVHILAIKETFVFVSLFILSANRMGDFRAPAHLMFFTHTVMVLCPSTVKHVKIIADHSTKLIYLSCLIFLVMMLIYRNVNESFYFFIKEAIHTFSLWRKFLQRKRWG